MDSQNPRRHDPSLHAGSRQDAPPHAAASAFQNAPSLREELVRPYRGALLPPTPSGPLSFTSLSAPAATRPAEEEIAPLTEAEEPSAPPEEEQSIGEEQPITVPVLSVQVTPNRWEQVFGGFSGSANAGAEDGIWDDPSDNGDDDMPGFPPWDADVLDDISSQLFLRDDAFALEGDGFALRERSLERWKGLRGTALVMLALALMVAVAVVGALIATYYAERATQRVTIPRPFPTVNNDSGGGVVIQPGQDISAPTPEAPKYQIGAWMSNNTPSGGSVKVFVRLSQDVAPVKDIPVTLSVEINGETLKYGPTNTDEYGLVTFTVDYGGISGSPAFVTASATIDEQTTLTAETVFVPR